MDAQTARHGSFDGGWNRHAADEAGWEEISIAIPLPHRSIVDIIVNDLPEGTPVRVLLDGRLVVESAGRVATRTWTDLRSPRVAIQWRGRELPNPNVSVRASQLRSVAELEQEHPELLSFVMKHQKPTDFELCGIFIVSFPAGDSTPVYGIFTVDKEALAKIRLAEMS